MPVDRAPLATVIIPARDAADTIGRTLAALAEQDLGQPYEVIVVDDGSADATAEAVRRAPLAVTLLSQGRRGPGHARNAGIEAARAPALAFTDADCFPEPGWLRAGLSGLESADLIQGRVIPDPQAPLNAFDRSIGVARESGLYETANLFVRRRLALAVGGFEDWLAVTRGKQLAEDVWFGWKVRRAGGRTGFAGDAVVHHAVIPRGGRGYILERARLVYFPAMVAKMPELRRSFLWGRIFLSRRTAMFDAALAGTVLGMAGLAAGWPPLTLLSLAAAGPYLAVLVRRGIAMGRWGPRVAVVELAADLIGFGALVVGSVRHRRAVL